jgi:hypothetical protein
MDVEKAVAQDVVVNGPELPPVADETEVLERILLAAPTDPRFVLLLEI